MGPHRTISESRRYLPPSLVQALTQRFGDRFHVGEAMCLEHGKSETHFAPMPPDAVVFATSPVPFAVREPLPGVDLDAVTPRPGAGVALWLRADNAQRVHDDLVRSAHWRNGRTYRYERWVADQRRTASQSGARRHPALAETETWLFRRYRVRFSGVALMPPCTPSTSEHVIGGSSRSSAISVWTTSRWPLS